MHWTHNHENVINHHEVVIGFATIRSQFYARIARLKGRLNMFYCNCGMRVVKRSWLREHIGLNNPKWPASNPTDEHYEISKDEWLIRQRRILLTTEDTEQIRSALISYGDY
jgi:hypothetical protein